jgi:hypothetical protein
MNKLLEALLIGLVKAKVPKVAKAYTKYEQYAVPLIRAERYYKHNKAAGLDTKTALMKAALDAKVPLDMLTNLIAEKSGDVGKVAIASVLGETQFADPNHTSFKQNF